LRQPPSNRLTRITSEREASLRRQERVRVRTAPLPVTSPVPAGAPSPSGILRLQHLAGNRAVTRHLAGHAVPRVCIQRFFQESDVRAIFPHVTVFTTLDEKGTRAGHSLNDVVVLARALKRRTRAPPSSSAAS
jgi:hypothetical protein